MPFQDPLSSALFWVLSPEALEVRVLRVQFLLSFSWVPAPENQLQAIPQLFFSSATRFFLVHDLFIPNIILLGLLKND